MHLTYNHICMNKYGHTLVELCIPVDVAYIYEYENS